MLMQLYVINDDPIYYILCINYVFKSTIYQITLEPRQVIYIRHGLRM